MCNPVAMTAASFGFQAFQIVQGHSLESAQAEAQTDFYNRNRNEAIRAAGDQYASIQYRQGQEQATASHEKQKLQRESLQARSTARVASGEAGVSGISVDGLINDFYGQEGEYARTIDANYEANYQHLRNSMKSVKAQQDSRINSVSPGNKPDFSTAAIRVLGAGINTYGDYINRKKLA